jgi:hypothetical protein
MSVNGDGYFSREPSSTSLDAILQTFTTWNVGAFVQNPWADLAAIGWLVVALSAIWATFHRDIRDTTLERISLALICIGSFARAFFIFGRGEIPIDGAVAPIALAIYAVIIWYKHTFVIPKRRRNSPERRAERKK